MNTQPGAEAMRARVLDALGEEWLTLAEVAAAIGEPPSERVRGALAFLYTHRRIGRRRPLGSRTYLWGRE